MSIIRNELSVGCQGLMFLSIGSWGFNPVETVFKGYINQQLKAFGASNRQTIHRPGCARFLFFLRDFPVGFAVGFGTESSFLIVLISNCAHF